MNSADKEKSFVKNKQNKAENSNWSGNMLERIKNPPENIPLYDVVSQLTKAQREKFIAGYDIKKFARIFEDSDIMDTADNFLKYGMNVSETSRRLYMHRNTLIYRLNKIQSVTGLDIRVFDMAVTFVILRILYELK